MQFVLMDLLDLVGTFVFAVSGAAVAIQHHMDLFGALVLAFAAGNAGGMTRDLLTGEVPPVAISRKRYLGASVLAGVLVFFLPSLIGRFSHPVLWFDAVGLAFFAVVATERALEHGLGPVMAALLGMLTGIGGGMLRDVLANEIPVVLRADLYAVAALAGAVVVAGGHVLKWPKIPVMLAGAAVCLILRFGAIQYGWHLPNA